MSSQLDRAVRKLRESHESLPDEISRTWEVTQRRIIREQASGYHVAMPTGWRGTQAEVNVAEHIALTASPDVVDAVAFLLGLLANGIWHEDTNHEPVLPALIRDAAESVGRIILRGES